MKKLFSIWLNLMFLSVISYGQTFMCGDNETSITLNSVNLTDSYGCNVSINVSISGDITAGGWTWTCGGSSGNLYLGSPNYTGTIGYYQDTGGNNCDGYAPICPTLTKDGIDCSFSASILPTNLTTISVQPYRNGSYLQWTTSQEKNNKGFEILRKTADTDWIFIGWVDGKGDSELSVDYSFFDEVEEVVYYQLKQIDWDGDFEYSPIVAFRPATTSKDLQLWPNLTTDLITIKGLSEYNQLIILNLNGVVMEQCQDSKQFEFDVSAFPNGPYFVLVKTKSGTTTARFIKK